MIRYFASHPTAANVLMVAIIILGITALPKLQRDTFPVIPATEVEIRASYPGATPAEVEDAVCQRIEDTLDDLLCRHVFGFRFERQNDTVPQHVRPDGFDVFRCDVTAPSDEGVGTRRLSQVERNETGGIGPRKEDCSLRHVLKKLFT